MISTTSFRSSHNLNVALFVDTSCFPKRQLIGTLEEATFHRPKARLRHWVSLRPIWCQRTLFCQRSPLRTTIWQTFIIHGAISLSFKALLIASFVCVLLSPSFLHLLPASGTDQKSLTLNLSGALVIRASFSSWTASDASIRQVVDDDIICCRIGSDLTIQEPLGKDRHSSDRNHSVEAAGQLAEQLVNLEIGRLRFDSLACRLNTFADCSELTSCLLASRFSLLASSLPWIWETLRSDIGGRNG
ncbi:hypothetical protein C8J56DRAFT_506817 [Mycena floridula]|nr:hypothetical protein C8J56DRAFT_506817 [Mycena floridula]